MSSVQPSLYPVQTVPRVEKPQTTQEAAHSKVNKKSLRLAILKSLYEGEWNADRWAAEHSDNEMFFLSVRPRFSEMNKAGMLHRTKIGLSNQGNSQDVFRLYPYIRTRMQILVIKYGIDKAAEEILTVYGL